MLRIIFKRGDDEEAALVEVIEEDCGPFRERELRGIIEYTWNDHFPEGDSWESCWAPEYMIETWHRGFRVWQINVGPNNTFTIEEMEAKS